MGNVNGGFGIGAIEADVLVLKALGPAKSSGRCWTMGLYTGCDMDTSAIVDPK